MSKHEDFLSLSPQQYITVYGMLSESLTRLLKTLLGEKFNGVNNPEQQAVVVEQLIVAKQENAQNIEALFNKGLFSRREYNAAIAINGEVGYSEKDGILLNSTFKLGLWCMAHKGYFSFFEYANGKQAVECVISIKDCANSSSWLVFNYNSVFGEELLPPTFNVGRVSKAEADEMANVGRAMDVIRSRASYFYTEWLRGQIKYDARMREIENQDYVMKITLGE